MEVREHTLAQQLGVKPGHAVDGMAAHRGQVGHAHMPVSILVDERQRRSRSMSPG